MPGRPIHQGCIPVTNQAGPHEEPGPVQKANVPCLSVSKKQFEGKRPPVLWSVSRFPYATKLALVDEMPSRPQSRAES
jgi:hypothetical protein